MSELRILLLGPPHIESNGVPIKVDTRKAIALAAYLAMMRQPQFRDVLANLLWPDYDQNSARAALRRTLSTLNKALGSEWLEADRESVSLRQDNNLFVDVHRFQQLLGTARHHAHEPRDACPSCLETLTEATALYRDDFLAGFSLRDSSTFDDWQFFQAESLRRELSWALEQLARLHSVEGRYDEAIDQARRWLALDSLNESAHRQLMQLYALAGQRNAALRQYRECVRVLDEELAVPPLEETTRLYQSIKEGDSNESARLQPRTANATGVASTAPATIEILSPVSPPAVSNYPLLGRSMEWDALEKAYTSAERDGRIVVLEGEAGIGKTRLAEEFLEDARSRGSLILAASCYEGEADLAYAPIGQILRSTVTSLVETGSLQRVPAQQLSEVARLLPELYDLRPDLPATAPLDTTFDQSRFLEGIRQVVRATGREGVPTVLFVDDLQWADAASLHLLAYLAHRLHGWRLVLLLTWRTEGMPPGHQLRRLVSDAQRTGAATMLSLKRLSRANVQELVSIVAGEGTDLSDRLYEETEGLPLFLAEYLTAVRKDASSTGEIASSLPGGVRDLLYARIAELGETAWQILSAGAVIGRSFDFDTLREASGRDEDLTVVALENLIAQGVVQEMERDGTPVYDFTHEKLRALVYEETSLARRRLLHRRVAETLVGQMRDPSEAGRLVGRIAHHFRLAGREEEAAHYFKLAANHARHLYANREALSHYQSALALGQSDTAELHEAIGDMHTLLGEYSAALKSYETAAALRHGSDVARVEHKLGDVYARRGEWESAESSYASALSAGGHDASPSEQAGLYADWSRTAYRRGQLDRAMSLATTALELATHAGDAQAQARAHNMLGVLNNSRGDRAEARRHLEASISLLDTMDDPGARAATLNNLALVYSADGDVEQARHLVEEALALCVAQGDRHREAALHSNLADLLHAAGDLDAAMSHFEQAAAIFADIGAEAGALQPEIWMLTEW